MSRWTRWYRRALPTYWIFLFFATHLPRLSIGGPRGSDKLMHWVAYALLAFLLWRFVETFARPRSWRFAAALLVTLALYAALDEWLQDFVGRSADPYDWLADMTGATAMLALLEWRRRARPPAARALYSEL